MAGGSSSLSLLQMPRTAHGLTDYSPFSCRRSLIQLLGCYGVVRECRPQSSQMMDQHNAAGTSFIPPSDVQVASETKHRGGFPTSPPTNRGGDPNNLGSALKPSDTPGSEFVSAFPVLVPCGYRARWRLAGCLANATDAES